MEERKRMGFGVMIFLVVLAGVLFAAYRKVWKDAALALTLVTDLTC